MRQYLILAKPGISGMSAASAFVGYWAAGGRDGWRLSWLCLGTLLAAFGAGAFNQRLEIEGDSLMRRTLGRPLVSGNMTPAQASVFAWVCSVLGVLSLLAFAGSLAAGLCAATILLYLLYTRLKRVTVQNTWVGALSGAAPPLIGWAAARGRLDPGAWSLFGIQFFWQIPHFLSLFWMYKDDYGRARVRVMAVLDPAGSLTGFQVSLHALALFLASLSPLLTGLAGLRYAYGALLLGIPFLLLGLRMSWTMARADARRLFFASLAYLPGLYALLLLS